MITWLKGLKLFLQVRWLELCCRVKGEPLPGMEEHPPLSEAERAELRQLRQQWHADAERRRREDPEFARRQKELDEQAEACLRIEDGWMHLKGWFTNNKDTQ